METVETRILVTVAGTQPHERPVVRRRRTTSQDQPERPDGEGFTAGVRTDVTAESLPDEPPHGGRRLMVAAYRAEFVIQAEARVSERFGPDSVQRSLNAGESRG